ncbi:MAG TPA: hypothetical protein VGZ22_18685 [Isosphaeraceae bacterium]|jgi:hypothetical protein|nr:hypothetical protein [Isosphaeraceae bacterium]
MRPGIRKLLSITLVAPGLVIVGLWTDRSHGDEPGRLGRLFRFGNNTSTAPAPGTSAPVSAPSTPSLLAPPGSPSFAASSGSADAIPIRPVPRNSRPVTESDPILTRVALARTNDGSQFCDFLHVYADGVVLDGSGIHHVSRETLKPLVEAISAGDAFRIHGHCGGPPADYIEQVHVVVYERSLGRLRANSFSFSGNTQGCDHAIKHLQAAIEAIQLKINGPPVMAPGSVPASSPGLTPAASPSPTARAIPLTPLN